MVAPSSNLGQQQRQQQRQQQKQRHGIWGGIFRNGRVFAICCVSGIVIVMICLAVLEVCLPSPSPSMSRLVRIDDDDDDDEKEDDHHTIPTVLSVMDPTTGLYIRAPGLDNPLYSYMLSSPSMHQELQQDVSFYTSTTAREKRRMLRKGTAMNKNQRGSVHLRLDKTTLYHFGDSLTLSWEQEAQDEADNDGDDENDIVALYCPSRPHDSDSFPLNAQHLLDAATVPQVRFTSQQHSKYGPSWSPKKTEASFSDGFGKNKWYIPSFPILRHDSCEFCYFQQNDQKDDHFLAGCASLELPHAQRTPTAVHLALTGDPTEMLVQFTTGDVGKPVAMYGPVSDPNASDASSYLVNKVHGDASSSSTYNANDMCQEPATSRDVGNFIPPGTLHQLILPNLQVATLYAYKVGIASGQGILWSDVYTFTSAPAVGSEPEQDKPLVLVAFGDQGCPEDGWAMGGQLTSTMVENEVHFGAATLVTHFGDLSYAMGAGHAWDEWFAMIQPYSSRVPLMVGVGNHEYDHTAGGANGKDPSGVESEDGFHPSWGNFGTDSGGECGVPTARRFTMPGTGNGVFWYSYNYGNVHMIMISSEHDLSPSSVQYQWLQQDLMQGVNRTQTPWIIVQTHRPMYNGESLWDENAVGVGMRFEFEDLLWKAQVDLVLAGHYHSYHRSCAGLYQSVCGNQGGPTHITVGTAGAPLDTGKLYNVAWTEFFSNHEWGYGRLKIYNHSAMEWNYVSSQNGTVVDTVWFHK